MTLAPMLLGFILAQSASPLDQLEQTLKTALAEQDFVKRTQLFDNFQSSVLGVISKDQIKAPSEFQRLAEIFENLPQNFEYSQIRYELALTALAGGDENIKPKIGRYWDNLLVSMSRGRRLGIDKIVILYGGERYKLRATARVIIATYKDPKSAISRARASQNNAEIQGIVDADQKVRMQDWSKLKQSDYEEIAKSDHLRLKRTKALIQVGGLKTAVDFGNAALVCQHGETFEDYALAHELSICAVLVGKKDESWLAGASYDRMLFNSGYPQRFATQYSMMGGQTKLSRFDPNGINDTERKTVVHKTLIEAQNRKWN